MGESPARKNRESETVGPSGEHRCLQSQLPEQHRFAMITTLFTNSIFRVARR
jgi:hypothetical protein